MLTWGLSIVTVVAIIVAALVSLSNRRLHVRMRSMEEAHNKEIVSLDTEWRQALDRANEHLFEERERYQERIRHLNRCAYRPLAASPGVRHIETPIGHVTIHKASGYFGETAIFVHFPIGFGYSKEVADAFKHATDGQFIMEPSPGNSSGGDDTADAIITAGRDYQAFQRGEQGYFKESEPPSLDAIAEIISHIIVHPVGVTA